MPEADLLQACLDELDGVDDFLARRELAAQRAPVLLGRSGIASSLAARIARTADSERNAQLDLFGVLVEQAQLDAENRGRFGEPFLAEARGAIDTLAAGGDLPDHAALGLARAFVRAGLEAPECLFPIFAGEPGTGQALAAFPGFLDREIDRLARHAGGDDHLLHDLLGNLMADLPSTFRPTFVQHVSGRDEEQYGRAALYWLLDRSPEVRLAAASGLSGRVRRAAMEPALPALVPLIRNWMPADSARPLLDTALREARLRGRFHPMAHPAGRPARFLAALPDGSGMQHLAATLELADGPACALVLVKAGHGVTIARIFRGDGALSAVSNLEDELGALDVPFEAFETALSAALADGLAEGRPPPARLIDVAATCGLSELRPRAMTARDWLAELDPEGAIASLPGGERDGLIGRSAAWPNDRPIMDTWFEGTALLDESLKAADDPRQTVGAFRARLEERRGDWALLVLRAGHVLKAAGDADWRSFAAVASALLDGRALKGIPIMDRVFLATIDAWHEEERRLRAGDGGRPDPLTALAAAAAWPEGELHCGASLASLDGYVAAAVLAPRASSCGMAPRACGTGPGHRRRAGRGVPAAGAGAPQRIRPPARRERLRRSRARRFRRRRADGLGARVRPGGARPRRRLAERRARNRGLPRAVPAHRSRRRRAARPRGTRRSPGLHRAEDADARPLPRPARRSVALPRRQPGAERFSAGGVRQPRTSCPSLVFSARRDGGGHAPHTERPMIGPCEPCAAAAAIAATRSGA